MSKGRRLFFALVPDAKVRRQVEQVQHSLALSGRAAKPAQFHATLSFLGMQPAELIPEIQNIASGLSFRPCRVVMNRFGQFPHAGVAWLGADDEIAPAFADARGPVHWSFPLLILHCSL